MTDSVVAELKRQYDEVPYASHPFPQTAPEQLAAVAHLFGLETPPVASARVLELGCSSGGNLVPFAARHPGARVLGMDLSEVHVRQGQSLVRDLGLGNLELREMDLSRVDAELGEFDYILCHGVYSWVPPHVQEAILRICRQNLSPAGVAYISYNTYPGWKTKEIVRDAMMLRGNLRDTPAERLAYARGMIDFLHQVAHRDGVLAKVLGDAAPLLQSSQDYYLLHEYLEPCNTPCYFKDFVAAATAQGLSYLADAEPSTMFVGNYGAQIADPLLKECGHDQVLLEQYVDFAVNRTFRQSLLVHAERAGEIRYRLDHSRFQAFGFAASLPCRDGELRPDATPQRFGDSDQTAISLVLPEMKAVVAALTRAWPGTVAYPELLAAAMAGTVPAQASAESSTQAIRARIEPNLGLLLEHLVISGRAKYRLQPVALCAVASARPRVAPAARRAVEIAPPTAPAVTFNAWHELVPLGPVERCLLPLLDGRQGRAELVERLRAEHLAGQMNFQRNGVTIAEAAEIEACLHEHVDAFLAWAAARKLLLA